MTSKIPNSLPSISRNSISTLREEISQVSTSSPSDSQLFFTGIPSTSYNSNSSYLYSPDATPTSSRSNSQDPLFKQNRRQDSSSLPTIGLFEKLRQLVSRKEKELEDVSSRRTRWSTDSGITIVASEEIPISKASSSSSTFELTVIFILIAIVGFTNESATGASLQSMQSYYGESYEMISLVFLVNISGYLVSCLISSYLSRRFGLQKSLAFAGVCQGTGALILALAPPFGVFVSSTFLTGVGSGLFDSLLTTAISYHTDKRPALMDWLYSSFAIGAVFPPIIIGSLIDAGYNWNTFYYLPFALTTFFSILAYPAFSSYTTPIDEVLDLPTTSGPIVAESTISRMKRTVKLPAVWLGFVLIFIAFATTDILSAWIVSFSISRDAQTVIRSRYLLSAFWFGASVGRIFLAKIGKKLSEISFSISTLLASAVGVSLLWIVTSYYANLVALLFTGFFLGPVTPKVISMISSRVPTSLKGAAISFSVAVGLLGASAGPLMFGIAVGHNRISVLPPVLMGMCLLAAIGWYFVPRRVEGISDESLEVNLKVEVAEVEVVGSQNAEKISP